MITVNNLLEKKRSRQKISMVTAYDFTSASIVENAQADIILVGDSLAMVIQGEINTLSVTMDEMVYHTKIVSKVAQNAMVIGDMPFMSYQTSPMDALKNAGRFIKEANARAVKLEGGKTVISQIEQIVNAGIPVMAHIGLTPQSISSIGNYNVQGRSSEAQNRIIEDAKAVEAAGAFAVVLECVPEKLARQITDTLLIPTIGIGAGIYCDGQVLVFHDLMGLTTGKRPKFVKQYANFYSDGVNAVTSFIREVDKLEYPSHKETYH